MTSKIPSTPRRNRRVLRIPPFKFDRKLERPNVNLLVPENAGEQEPSGESDPEQPDNNQDATDKDNNGSKRLLTIKIEALEAFKYFMNAVICNDPAVRVGDKDIYWRHEPQIESGKKAYPFSIIKSYINTLKLSETLSFEDKYK